MRFDSEIGLSGQKVVLLLTGALFIAACGGGDDAAEQTPSPGGNQPPTISGTPLTQVMQGTQYSFTPTANDPNSGDTLTFSIVNMPSWAAFTASTGRLSGTPGQADVRSYSNIRISVSDGTTTVSLPAFSISVVATATGAATLTWNPPTQNTDGSALTDLAGYRIYWGTSQGNYPNTRTLTGAGFSSTLVEQLTPATWYFVVTAFDGAGNESAYSNVATKTVL